jgi:hypothetical protein
MAMLLHPAANRLYVIERQTDLGLPKLQHRLQMIRYDSDVDVRFGKLHERAVSISGRVKSRTK